eukprot:jgi/Botrbrau1/6492/Bobra.0034s0065.1
MLRASFSHLYRVLPVVKPQSIEHIVFGPLCFEIAVPQIGSSPFRSGLASICTSASVWKKEPMEDDSLQQLRKRFDERLKEKERKAAEQRAELADRGITSEPVAPGQTDKATAPAEVSLETTRREMMAEAHESVTQLLQTVSSPDTNLRHQDRSRGRGDGAVGSVSEEPVAEREREEQKSPDRARRKPLRVYVHEPIPAARPDPVDGYARLGIRPVPSKEEGQLPTHAGQLSPRRVFYPSQTYQPEDLVQRPDGEVNRKWVAQSQKRPSEKEVMSKADFRNLPFLSKYVTEMGRLIPRRRTRLPRKAQRHVCRQIKIARSMALLHPLQKLFEFDPAAQLRDKRLRQMYPEAFMETSDEEDEADSFWDLSSSSPNSGPQGQTGRA